MKKTPVFRLILLIISLNVPAAMAQSIQFDAVTLSHIQAEPLSSVIINGSDDVSNEIPAGTILVYQTSEGRYGKLEIENYGYNLTLTWKTFSAFGSTYTEGSKLVINGTWSCDLDQGIQISSGTDSDFWWQQVNSITRYLIPVNNAQFAIYTPKLDLVVSSGTPTVSPAAVLPGDTVILSAWTVRNTGTGDAGSFSSGFYLSDDPVITANDTYLGGNSNAGLAAGSQFDWGGPTLTIPGTTQPGNYYIGILVDRSGTVDESDDFNNYVSVPFTYDYTFGDGSQTMKGTSQETHTYTQKGSYTAKVRVTDATGKVYDFFRNILVTGSTELVTFKTDLDSKADQIKLTVTPDDIPDILNDAQDIIGKSLSALTNADDATRIDVQTAVQKAGEKLITNTRDQFAGFITNNQIQPGDIQNTLTGLEKVVSSMVSNDLALPETSVTDLQTISENIFSATADTLLAKENLTTAQLNDIKNDTAKAQVFLKDKKYLLPGIISGSAVQAEAVTDFNAADVNTIAVKHQFTAKQTASL